MINRITAAKIGAYTIALVAATYSFGHQVHLLEQADLSPLFGFVPSAWVAPFTVDLLAMVALTVRTADDVTERSRKIALLPLVLAGGTSVAANVAEARNIVAVVVGVWTVLAYILAELLVQRLERKAASVAPATPSRNWTVTPQEKEARKRSGYHSMTPSAKAEWTKRYRERIARRNPISPGRVPVTELNAEMALSD